MYRSEQFSAGLLTERVEIERLDSSTVEYRRYDGSLALQDQRVATTEEEVEVDAHDAGEALNQKRTNIDQAVATLRTWAADAQTITITTANHEAVLQVVVDRLGVFFDRFADLIETR